MTTTNTTICDCGEHIDQHTGKYLVCPDGIHEFTPREDATSVARELLAIQLGSVADARALADDADPELRDAIHEALDELDDDGDGDWYTVSGAADYDRAARESLRCESGWTGDRCTFALFHDGPHSND